MTVLREKFADGNIPLLGSESFGGYPRARFDSIFTHQIYFSHGLGRFRGLKSVQARHGGPELYRIRLQVPEYTLNPIKESFNETSLPAGGIRCPQHDGFCAERSRNPV